MISYHRRIIVVSSFIAQGALSGDSPYQVIAPIRLTVCQVIPTCGVPIRFSGYQVIPTCGLPIRLTASQVIPTCGLPINPSHTPNTKETVPFLPPKCSILSPPSFRIAILEEEKKSNCAQCSANLDFFSAELTAAHNT